MMLKQRSALRDTLDYYDGQGHAEFGQPMDIVRAPTPTFEWNEYSGISSSSSSEYEIINERPSGPRKPSRPTSPRGHEPIKIERIYVDLQDSEEEEEEKRPRTRAEKKNTVWFRDPDEPEFPVIMYRYSYSSDGEDGRWEGPR